MNLLKSAPDVGNLLIIMKNYDHDTAVFSCPETWVQDIDSTDKDAVNGLIYKVIMNVKEA